VELGCARSVWLPYLARTYGFSVVGVDYSELGCAQARTLLEREQVRGEVICSDFRSPPATLLGSADAVVSFGLLEHFDDTAGAVRAAARFLRPGGVLVTEVPNLVGWMGGLQRAINRPVFDAHVCLDRDTLAQSHRDAGLEVLESTYAVLCLPTMLNTEGMPATWKRRTTELTVRLAAYAATPLWVIDERLTPLPVPAALAAYVVCVARLL
jgi:SAM-dependent methyltransferase